MKRKLPDPAADHVQSPPRRAPGGLGVPPTSGGQGPWGSHAHGGDTGARPRCASGRSVPVAPSTPGRGRGCAEPPQSAASLTPAEF